MCVSSIGSSVQSAMKAQANFFFQRIILAINLCVYLENNLRPEIDTDRLHDILDAGIQVQQTTQPNDPSAKFCSADCRNNYREERIQGKPLTSTSMSAMSEARGQSYKAMCSELKLCCYCLEKLEK